VTDKGVVDLFAASGRAVSDLGLSMCDPGRVGARITGFSVRPPKEDRGEFLMVLRGLDDEGLPIVAFSSATTLDECFRGVVARLRNGSLVWRADQFERF